MSIYPTFRIERHTWRPPADLVKRVRAFPTAMLSDAMNKMNTMEAGIVPIWASPMPLCGPALTVRIRPGDNAMCVKAIALAHAGDVIVVQASRDRTHSIWGGIMALQAKANGIAGLVTDGLVRDTAQLRQAEFPVWAVGVTPLAPARSVPPGQIGTSIVCGNTIVSTGDIVVADEDGVVVIPADDLERVLTIAAERVMKEAAWIDGIRRGDQVLLERVDQLLREAGCVEIKGENQ